MLQIRMFACATEEESALVAASLSNRDPEREGIMIVDICSAEGHTLISDLSWTTCTGNVSAAIDILPGIIRQCALGLLSALDEKESRH